MDISFEDQVVLVTGSGQGLGRTYALEFGRRGAHVVVNDIAVDDEQRSVAEQTARDIRRRGGSASVAEASLSDPDAARTMVERIVAEHGRIDVLVNNAGTTAMTPFDEQSLGDFDALLNVHVRGAFTATQAAYRTMKAKGYGRIVFTSSAAGVFGRASGSGYSTAKGALIGMMNTLSLDGIDHGVLANAVLPSASTSIRGFDRSKLSPSIRDSLERLVPFSAPEFVSPLVVFLASSACEVTHRTYSSVGGRYAWVYSAVSEGWMTKNGTPPSVEEMAARFDVIDEPSLAFIPMSLDEEFADVADRRSDKKGASA